MELQDVQVQLVNKVDEPRFLSLMREHHYIGAQQRMAQTLWYVATYQGEWVALLSFSIAALKCKARDQWIGWPYRHQYDRLKYLTNNTRFLILPDWHVPNLGSRVLSLCEKRIAADSITYFGHTVLILETFVDPARFHGTVYRAANWTCVGKTRGFRRHREGYIKNEAPKLIFMKPLRPDARALLSRPTLDLPIPTGVPKMMILADQMRALPDFFKAIPDHRRAAGRRHKLPTLLALAAAAILSGMRGYKGIKQWIDQLGQKGLERFGCRYQAGQFIAPSLNTVRECLMRVDPAELDRALQAWNKAYAQEDQSLAIDGKTMRNAMDEEGRQVQIMSAIGHQTGMCYTQKKSTESPPKAEIPSAPTKSKRRSLSSTPSPSKAKRSVRMPS